ncbi:hypothetical protein ACLEC1_09130 [Lonsdalea quercina]|uniref:hypothetical protein n=1 Tax=Lonsdalea quercina TaxID=71657 RepID=UPI0039769166
MAVPRHYTTTSMPCWFHYVEAHPAVLLLWFLSLASCRNSYRHQIHREKFVHNVSNHAVAGLFEPSAMSDGAPEPPLSATA